MGRRLGMFAMWNIYCRCAERYIKRHVRWQETRGGSKVSAVCSECSLRDKMSVPVSVAFPFDVLAHCLFSWLADCDSASPLH